MCHPMQACACEPAHRGMQKWTSTSLRSKSQVPSAYTPGGDELYRRSHALYQGCNLRALALWALWVVNVPVQNAHPRTCLYSSCFSMRCCSTVHILRPADIIFMCYMTYKPVSAGTRNVRTPELHQWKGKQEEGEGPLIESMQQHATRAQEPSVDSHCDTAGRRSPAMPDVQFPVPRPGGTRTSAHGWPPRKF
jgi:hypothetical protein